MPTITVYPKIYDLVSTKSAINPRNYSKRISLGPNNRVSKIDTRNMTSHMIIIRHDI